jgi:hypothetical protein
MRALADTIKDPSGRLLALLVAKDLDWFAEWLALPKVDWKTSKRVAPGLLNAPCPTVRAAPE